MQGLQQETPDAMERPINIDIGLWILENLSGLFRRPFDRELAKRLTPSRLNPPALADCIQELGLGVELSTWPTKENAQHATLPLVIFFQPRSDEPSDSDSHESDSLTPAIVIQTDGSHLALVRPGDTAPQVLSFEQVQTMTTPWVLHVNEPAVQDHHPDDHMPVDGEERPFGFSWFFPEFLRHRSLWRDVLLASLSLQLVGLATPLFTQIIIDKVIAHHSQSTLLVLGGAMVAFMLFTSVMSWLRQYLILHTGSRIDAVLGAKVMRHLLRLPMPFFEYRSTGTLVARLQGIETLREFVSGAAIGLVLDLPFLLLLLAVMFGYNWGLTLLALGIVSLILIASMAMVPIFRRRLDRQFLLGARNQAFLTEYISGMETVKSLQMEPDLDRRYGDYLSQYLSAGVATRQAANTYQVTASALEQTMTLSILIAGAWYLMHNPGFTVGMLIAFQMFASRLSQPMMRLVGLWQEFQQASVAARRLADILDMPTEPVALTQRNAAHAPAQVQLQDLGFRYSEQHPWIYRHLDLSLPSGGLCVLTGGSGCGKSTLAKLLLGFHLAEEGRILLDGHDTRHLTANELRSAYGVVPQETVLFSGSIYDNLIMASPHAHFDDVIAACAAAGIHDTINRLPQGYETRVGEHGVGLSGGQRQRVAVARALLKRPRLLIFDEAASSLDSETAEQLAGTINKLKGKATILFIAHRIPQCLNVDQHIDLERLTEKESPDDETSNPYS